MEPYFIYLTVHIFAFAWGVGGATVSDYLFLKSIKDRVISKYELNTLTSVSRVVIGGIILSVISGFLLLYTQYLNSGQWGLLQDPRFQMKVALVGLIILNGFVFHKIIFPLMKKYKGESLDNKEINSKIWMFALSGSVSITSWYGAALLALLDGFIFTFKGLIIIYLGVLLLAFVSSYFILSKKLFSKDRKRT